MGHYFHFSSGVFKVDVKSARYADLLALAQKRSQDESFYSLVIRKVSRLNYGIQFIYYTTDEKKSIDHYRTEIESLYGTEGNKWVYAVDYAVHTSVMEDPADEKSYRIATDRIKENILVHKPIVW